MLGILLIDKPEGITSHDVVSRLRRRFDTRRVGHAGTLDPLATGLLVVAIGPATRFLQYLPLEPKEYVAKIRFGQSTTTFDREGEVTETRPVPAGLPAQVEEARQKFLGLIQQVPPMFSAVKKEGKPLYVYARKGEEVEREARTVHIERFDLLGYEDAVLEARIVCSGGTYVRTLAHDLGEAVGCGAHLAALVRTGVGRFRLDEAAALEEVGPADLIPLDQALPPMPIVALNQRQASSIRMGQQIGWDKPLPERLVGLRGPDGDVIGVARAIGDLLQPECVIPEEVARGQA
jgi:tRNA pseudouridine55 synthase